MSRFLFCSAVYIIVVKDNKIYLSERKNTQYMDGYFETPSGHIEENEGALKTVIREAKEEIGIIVNKKDVEFAHIMQRRRAAFDGTLEYFDFYFKVKRWKKEPMICEPEKCGGAGWYKMDNLPENIVPNIKIALEYIKNNIKYSEVGIDG